MKKLLFSSLLFSLAIFSQAQSTRIKWKQVESGLQGQIAVVGVDGNGHWVTPVFTSWSDTLNYLATKTDLNNAKNKESISGAFSTATGTVTITKRDGSSFTYGLDGRYLLQAEKAAANGVASLGADGKVPSSQLPPQRISDVFVVGSQSAMLAVTALKGDFAVRTDVNKTFILQATPASDINNWIELPQNVGITSVNGQTGPSVTLTTNDVSEGATNKYFSNLLARGAFSGTGYIAYNGSTGVFSHNTSGITAGTYNSLTIDAYGHATSGSNITYLVPGDLNNYYTKTQLQTGGQAAVNWNNLTNKPANLGASEAKDQFTSGTSSVITLVNTPLFPSAVQVFLNGVLLQGSDYALSGTTLTLGFSRETTDVVTIKYSY